MLTESRQLGRVVIVFGQIDEPAAEAVVREYEVDLGQDGADVFELFVVEQLQHESRYGRDDAQKEVDAGQTDKGRRRHVEYQTHRIHERNGRYSAVIIPVHLRNVLNFLISVK